MISTLNDLMTFLVSDAAHDAQGDILALALCAAAVIAGAWAWATDPAPAVEMKEKP